jgi:hypothetical protein
MEKATLNIIAKVLEVLIAAGFLQRKQPKRLLKMMNIDTSHSVIRVPLLLASLYGGSTKSDIKAARYMLTAVGAVYVAMGAAGAADKKVGGALPSRLTNFDIVYHFAVGGAALWLGTRAGRMMKPE